MYFERILRLALAGILEIDSPSLLDIKIIKATVWI